MSQIFDPFFSALGALFGIDGPTAALGLALLAILASFAWALRPRRRM